MENETLLCDLSNDQYETGSELDNLARECGYASGKACCTERFNWDGTYGEAMEALREELEELQNAE